jgi:hypothetical protein
VGEYSLASTCVKALKNFGILRISFVMRYNVASKGNVVPMFRYNVQSSLSKSQQVVEEISLDLSTLESRRATAETFLAVKPKILLVQDAALVGKCIPAFRCKDLSPYSRAEVFIDCIDIRILFTRAVAQNIESRMTG